MEKIFVIVVKNCVNWPEDIFVTKAKTSQEAIVKYSKEYVREKDFIDDLESRVVNDAFWGTFFNSIIFTDDGKYNGVEYNHLDQYDAISIEFQKNVEQYFGEENKSLSKELIDFYKDENIKYEDLSEDILSYIGLKEVQDEIQYYIIKEVEL